MRRVNDPGLSTKYTGAGFPTGLTHHGRQTDNEPKGLRSVSQRAGTTDVGAVRVPCAVILQELRLATPIGRWHANHLFKGTAERGLRGIADFGCDGCNVGIAAA